MNKSIYRLAQLMCLSTIVLFLSACPNVPIKEELNSEPTSGASNNPQNTGNGQSTSGNEQGNQPVTTGLNNANAINGTNINNPVCAPDCVYNKNAIFQATSKLAVKIIYFDYDRSKIKPEFVETLEQHAIYLTEFPKATVRLEGHSDERGAREYNIALGEQRSRAVKRFFQLKGVNDSQISIVSFGEELPANLGHNLDAWALNRRVEIVYE